MNMHARMRAFGPANGSNVRINNRTAQHTNLTKCQAEPAET